MKKWTRLSLAVMLLISAICFLGALTACAPKVVAIPDSRELVDLSKGSEPRPGWVGISGGYLRDIFLDLDKCKK